MSPTSFANYRVQMFRITASTSPLFDKASFKREGAVSLPRRYTPFRAVITLMHDAGKKWERKKGNERSFGPARAFERETRGKLSYPTGFRSWLPSCANRASHFWAGRSGEERVAALTQRDASSSGSPPAVHPPELPC